MDNQFRFYNTLTRKIETVIPHEDGKIKMYTCGPTVYHFAHIGNLRTYIMEDILVRGLSYVGYDVKRVMNITMAVFDVGQHVVNNAAGVISGNTAVDATEAISRIVDALEDMELGDLFLLSMETMLISVTMHILSIIITVILHCILQMKSGKITRLRLWGMPVQKENITMRL